ncbi:DMT family transporter [Aquabacterium sp. CECT 9606]|uniref:DMT family transporter n=1 Tax=Aquabacterium sp. CECT 9606 TaxID=2845822 RepID=UPI0021116738|nr:DMT family transporter [Aquabacterium sp. CECT 9606]
MKLDARTLLLLTLPPMMWAGNAVVGRLLVGLMPPVQMNAVRWSLVAVLLAPMAWRVWRRPGEVWARWPYLAVIGALGVGTYNSLQYLALQTSTPLNVTLIGASIPVWMMVVGAVCFGQPVSRRQWGGAALSTVGVLLVIAQGQWRTLLQVQLVPGDLLMLLASLAWAFYSWLLAKPPQSMRGDRRPAWDWAEFLWLQILFGLVWAVLCSGLEWAAPMGTQATPVPSAIGAINAWPPLLRLAVGLVFVALGPSIVAYRCWGLGVQAVGPTLAAFFINLTPIFAAVWAAILLGQLPRWYHPCALLLIVAGIALSSSKRGTQTQ